MNDTCVSTENLLSYNVPQGMVRGAMLELLDITYDGLEDSVTGFLTGGLGQLVDGKYGAENYRAVGENGIVRGVWLFTHYIIVVLTSFTDFVPSIYVHRL